MTDKIRLAGVSGSLRRGSHCTAVLRTLQATIDQPVEMALACLNEIPLYNQDFDDVPPPSVIELKSEIARSDGLVICSPEYNYGMPGVLKNALDWVSRPPFASPLKGKPVLLITCSPAFTGGVRAQSQLLDTLTATLSRVLIRRPVIINAVHTKIESGKLADEASLKIALEGIHDLIVEIMTLRKLLSIQ